MIVLESFTHSVEKCIWNVTTPIDIQLSSLNNKSESFQIVRSSFLFLLLSFKEAVVLFHWCSSHSQGTRTAFRPCLRCTRFQVQAEEKSLMFFLLLKSIIFFLNVEKQTGAPSQSQRALQQTLAGKVIVGEGHHSCSM